MTAAAAAISLFLGLGFGLPCIVAIVHLIRTGEIWTFLGFPTYGEGPFVDFGIQTTPGLLAAFLVVCLAEIVLAKGLLAQHHGARLAAIALLPFEMVFWIGFALPFGPVLGIVRTVLVMVPSGARTR